LTPPSPPAPDPDPEWLLRLYCNGSTEEELADLIGVHPARVPAILELAVEESRARKRDRAAAAIRLMLEGLDSVIEASVRIVVTRCPGCGGDEPARISCRKCRWADTAYGPTGYAYPPTRRTTALRRIRYAEERRVKLLGLDKPPPTTVTGTSRHPKLSGPIVDYLEQSLKKKLPGVELEDEEVTADLAEFALESELLLIDALIREAAQLALRKCWACGGDEAARAKCEACDRTGYFYRPDMRLVALTRIRRASGDRVKLLGLDKKPLRPPVDPELAEFFEMLNNLSPDEVAAELEILRTGPTR
jgi:hypothetical protein